MNRERLARLICCDRKMRDRSAGDDIYVHREQGSYVSEVTLNPFSFSVVVRLQVKYIDLARAKGEASVYILLVKQ